MPVYNERYRVREAVAQVLAAPLPAGLRRHLVVVDDGSSDGTRAILRELAARHPEHIKLIEHVRNQGKGAAIRTAIQAATGDFAIIQDADLEYDPQDYPLLLGPLLTGQADAVFGSRYAARTERRVLAYWHTRINGFLTWLSNMATNLDLTDMETCYKAFRLDILQSIPLRCDRFGMEPELTAKVAKRRLSVYEVPISYHGRTYQEGKKITAWDAVKAVLTIGYYWLVDDLYEGREGHAHLHRLSEVPRFTRWLADTLKPFVGKRVLEVGSGLGSLTSLLLPREHYTVTDVDPLHLRHLGNRYGRNPRVRVRKLDLAAGADFETERGCYDTVVCREVLEHVPDDAAGLRNMYAALEPGGRAVVVVPQGERLVGEMDAALGRIRRYTRAELVEKAKTAGFQIEQLSDFNRSAAPAAYTNAVLLKRRRWGRWQLGMFDRLVGLFRRVDGLLPWQGTSLIAILRRPGAAPTSLREAA
jgi:glycosyltransferase involved in cell wall biosynthesis